MCAASPKPTQGSRLQHPALSQTPLEPLIPQPLLYMSASFPVTPQRHPPVIKHFLVGHSAWKHNIFILSGRKRHLWSNRSTPVQTWAIPLKSGEMQDLVLPLLVPRYPGDPALSTAPLLIKCQSILWEFFFWKDSVPVKIPPSSCQKRLKISQLVQNTLICLKVLPVPCYRQQCKVCGKEKDLVEKRATFILI